MKYRNASTFFNSPLLRRAWREGWNHLKHSILCHGESASQIYIESCLAPAMYILNRDKRFVGDITLSDQEAELIAAYNLMQFAFESQYDATQKGHKARPLESQTAVFGEALCALAREMLVTESKGANCSELAKKAAKLDKRFADIYVANKWSTDRFAITLRPLNWTEQNTFNRAPKPAFLN